VTEQEFDSHVLRNLFEEDPPYTYFTYTAGQEVRVKVRDGGIIPIKHFPIIEEEEEE
jgi:hypothetical protein